MKLPRSLTTVTLFSKFLAISLFLIIILSGFYIKTEYQQKLNPPATILTDETTSWKTYNNYKGHYFFKYPNGLTLKVAKTYSVDGVSVESPTLTFLLYPGIPNANRFFRMTFSYWLNSETNLKTFIDKYSWCAEIRSNNGKGYNLDGNQALIYLNTPCGSWGSDNIYTLKNGYVYGVRIDNAPGYSEIKTYYDQILSTFKFTNQ